VVSAKHPSSPLVYGLDSFCRRWVALARYNETSQPWRSRSSSASIVIARQVSDAAGLVGVHLHDLRHTTASLLIARNFSLPIVGGLLGHSQPSTTARYAHQMDAPVRNAVGQLGRVLVPGTAGGAA
jgi:integrase